MQQPFANWYQPSMSEVVSAFSVNPETGLSSAEVASRLATHGPNRIEKSNVRPLWKLVFEQFTNFMVLILIGAALLSLYLADYKGATVLFAIVLINATVGFLQEYKSEKVLEKLKNLVIAKTKVIREGMEKEIASDGLVPGDIVVLDEGDGIPADLRLVSSTGFSTNDFILTGESDPQPKNEKVVLDHEVEVTDRNNCVYMGTTVARGEARGVVFATGMQTEIGQIAHHSEEVANVLSPLQRELNDLSKRLTQLTFLIGVGLFVVRLFFHDTANAALVFSISVAACMVPEALPAQISVALSLGVGRMARKNALVKQLSAVETLGSASVVATDKTGTITKNEMTITHCSFDGEEFSITGTGYAPDGEIFDASGKMLRGDSLGDLKVFFLDGYLSSTGRVNPPDGEHKGWYALGDPTESAFATLALKSGHDLSEIDAQYPRLALFPFDSDRKRMSIVREHKGKRIAFAKGAIESILSICTHDIADGQVTELTTEERERLLHLASVYSSESLRVIAVAYKDLDPSPGDKWEQNDIESGLTFAGFVTMLDPPHEQVRDAVTQAFDAHIKLVMITGDNAVTARAIAAKIGMVQEHGESPEVIDGDVLRTMQDEAVMDLFHHRAVIFSRVAPSDKLRIVGILQAMGEIVAVTGDGVNDTLSLKKADIGVAMGMNGSEVAKEASDMILLDDNFTSIIVAVREGRAIFHNLKKTMLLTVMANFGELVCVMLGFISAFWGYPMAILALQILAVDLAGELFPLMMLTYDPPESSLMSAPPRDPHQHVLNGTTLRHALWSGVFIGTAGFVSFLIIYHLNAGHPLQYPLATTAAYVGIVLAQLFNILSFRTERSLLSPYLWSNRHLLGGYAVSLGLVLLIVYLPILNSYLGTAPLSLSDWIFPIGAGLAAMSVNEVRKAWGRR